MRIETLVELSDRADLGSPSESSFYTVEIATGEIEEPKALFVAIAAALQFPDYFGHNWAALDECFSDYFVLEDGGLGSEFGERPGIVAEAVHIVFVHAGTLLRHGPGLVGRLATLLDYTRMVNQERKAADLTVTFQVENERERAEFADALHAGRR